LSWRVVLLVYTIDFLAGVTAVSLLERGRTWLPLLLLWIVISYTGKFISIIKKPRGWFDLIWCITGSVCYALGSVAGIKLARWKDTLFMSQVAWVLVVILLVSLKKVAEKRKTAVL
jgi:hypothetical protein